ncbi:MAG: hypothetical protein ACRBK7_19075 [Acidimicrobiales bacterium]
MANGDQAIVRQLREWVSEEMYLLGQELDDSLDGSERKRLTELSALLDSAAESLVEHRAARPHR